MACLEHCATPSFVGVVVRVLIFRTLRNCEVLGSQAVGTNRPLSPGSEHASGPAGYDAGGSGVDPGAGSTEIMLEEQLA
jgi:hypothetical protein